MTKINSSKTIHFKAIKVASEAKQVTFSTATGKEIKFKVSQSIPKKIERQFLTRKSKG